MPHAMRNLRIVLALVCVFGLFTLAPAAAKFVTACSYGVCATAEAAVESEEENNAPDLLTLICAYLGQGPFALYQGRAWGSFTGEDPNGNVPPLPDCQGSCTWGGFGGCGDEDTTTYVHHKCDAYVDMWASSRQFIFLAQANARESRWCGVPAESHGGCKFKNLDTGEEIEYVEGQQGALPDEYSCTITDPPASYG